MRFLRQKRNIILILPGIFLQKLKADAGELGLQILEQLTVPIDYEDFEAEKSEVSIALTVTDPHSWVPTFPDDDKWDAKFKRMVEVQLGFCHK